MYSKSLLCVCVCGCVGVGGWVGGWVGGGRGAITDIVQIDSRRLSIKVSAKISYFCCS